MISLCIYLTELIDLGLESKWLNLGKKTILPEPLNWVNISLCEILNSMFSHFCQLFSEMQSFNNGWWYMGLWWEGGTEGPVWLCRICIFSPIQETWTIILVYLPFCLFVYAEIKSKMSSRNVKEMLYKGILKSGQAPLTQNRILMMHGTLPQQTSDVFCALLSQYPEQLWMFSMASWIEKTYLVVFHRQMCLYHI